MQPQSCFAESWKGALTFGLWVLIQCLFFWLPPRLYIFGPYSNSKRKRGLKFLPGTHSHRIHCFVEEIPSRFWNQWFK
jgi:hypothetical protein